MFRKIFVLIEKFWGNYFPKRQILLKTGSQTKFFNLSSSTQVTFIFAIIILISWSVFSLLIFSITALNLGTVEAQFQRERVVYDNQIGKIAEENHKTSKKFVNSEKKLEAALDAIEYFQYEMTKAQLREEELQAGLKLLQELTKQRKSKKFFFTSRATRRVV
jgi:biopolymer transport protein ExbB/TolQ